MEGLCHAQATGAGRGQAADPNCFVIAAWGCSQQPLADPHPHDLAVFEHEQPPLKKPLAT